MGTLKDPETQLARLQSLQEKVNRGRLTLPDNGARLEARLKELKHFIKGKQKESSLVAEHKVAPPAAGGKNREQADGVGSQQQAHKMNKADLQNFVKVQEVGLRAFYPSVREVVIVDAAPEKLLPSNAYNKVWRLDNYHIFKRTAPGKGVYTALECLPAQKELANTGVCAVGEVREEDEEVEQQQQASTSQDPSTRTAAGMLVELQDITSWDACIGFSANECTAIIQTKLGQYCLGTPSTDYQEFHSRLAAVLFVIPCSVKSLSKAEEDDRRLVRNLSVQRLAKLLTDDNEVALHLAWEDASQAEGFMRVHAHLLAAAAEKLRATCKPQQPLLEALVRVFSKLEKELPQERTVRRSGRRGKAAALQPLAMLSTPKGKATFVVNSVVNPDEAQPSTPANQEKRPAAATPIHTACLAPANNNEELRRVLQHAAREDEATTAGTDVASQLNCADVNINEDTDELPKSKRRCIIEDDEEEEEVDSPQPQLEAPICKDHGNKAFQEDEREVGFISLEMNDAGDNHLLVHGNHNEPELHEAFDGTYGPVIVSHSPVEGPVAPSGCGQVAEHHHPCQLDGALQTSPPDSAQTATVNAANSCAQVEQLNNYQQQSHDDVSQPSLAGCDADMMGQAAIMGRDITNNVAHNHQSAPDPCAHVDYGEKSAELLQKMPQLVTQILTQLQPEQRQAIMLQVQEECGGALLQQQHVEGGTVTDTRAEGLEQNTLRAMQQSQTECRLKAASNQRSDTMRDDVGTSYGRGLPSDLQHTFKGVMCFAEGWPHCIKLKLDGIKTLNGFKQRALKKFAAAHCPIADKLELATITYKDQSGASCALADDDDFEELQQADQALQTLLWSFS